jgi:hypothetical protein
LAQPDRNSLPPQLRAAYTECERAVLTIIAREVKRHGICDHSVGQIAAEAGVCVRTVQNAIAEAVRQGHICREEREQKGRKNLTNILRIMSLEWLAWIKRGPIGCKVFSATKIIDSKQEALERSKREFPRVARILRVSGSLPLTARRTSLPRPGCGGPGSADLTRGTLPRFKQTATGR